MKQYVDRFKGKEASTHDVIYNRVMTAFIYRDGYAAKRPMEDQIEQCVQIMSQLIEHLGLDATLFNDDYVKSASGNNETFHSGD